MTWVAQFLVRALFTLNEKYFVSDKYTTWLADPFPLRPRGFTASLAQVLSHPGGTPAELHRSSRLLTSLWRGNCWSRQRSLQTSLESFGRALRQRESWIGIK